MRSHRCGSYRSPLHHWWLARGVGLVERDGWLRPPPGAESVLLGDELTLTDVSHCAKTRLIGTGVAEVTTALVGHSGVPDPGRIASLATSPSTLLCRLRADHALILSAGASDPVLDDRLTQLTVAARVSRWDATTALACFELHGRRALEVLACLTALDLSTALPPGGCAETSFAQVYALLVRCFGQRERVLVG
ncbi:MAG: hypothetical protein NZO58_10655, partial [Gemmataceae bacterium]|nr:hypothetical protein [Gemmataceae bacterium]